MMENIPIVDLPEALKRSMGDADFLRMLLNEFRQTIPGILCRLKDACRNGDMPALENDAHQLKGVAANLGAKALAAAALKLEQIGNGDNPESCALVLGELEQAVERFNQHLNGIDWKAVGSV